MQLVKRLVSRALFQVIGFRPAPVAAAVWDKEYAAGHWDFLGEMGSLGGLVSVLGYCQFLGPASILDVGCGAGLLAKKLKVLPYKSYLGIDLSPQAVAQAQDEADARTAFAVSGAEDFQSDRRFDVIIFSQILNYIPQPDALLSRYAKFLTPQGRIIVSLYDSGRNRAAWSLIERPMQVEDMMTVSQGDGMTTTKVLKLRI
ncbi:MAG: methyltransferase domain-containing protein [Rhizomicrobium sp.]